MKYAIVICLYLGTALAVAQAASDPVSRDRIVLPSTVIPSHYNLDVTVDPGSTGFSGSEIIDVAVEQPTQEIILNAANLEIKGFTVASAGSGAGVASGASKDVVLNEQHETAALTLSTPLAPGAYTLTIAYTGKINDSFAGLFRTPYDTPQGHKVALFTQFENSDARRFFPCWDEPALKATFALSVTVPANEMAVSNMPAASIKDLPNGRKQVAFAKSPRMSTYLLFFGVGDFERVARQVDGVDVGVIVKRGDTAKAGFALDTAAQILPFYHQYFGVKYPLPKLDLLGGPGQSQFFSAMENWGAIFYVESALEIDPALSTEGDRQEVYNVVAHEMAHQWFGDLVTMQWWDDVWLNEGFATWMASKVTDHFHPEWRVAQQNVGRRERALVLDAKQGTHPIIQPIRDVLQASQAFDSITYVKGFAVISMLESYVGNDAFQAGVRQYISKHAYGNTVSDDLWNELDRTAGKPISDIAHDFTLQAGVPLIKVVDKGATTELQEERFAVDASGSKPTSWHVPVVAQAFGAKAPWQGIVTHEHPASINTKPTTGIVVNATQAGYFRTLYEPTLLHPLVTHFGELSPIDQAGLLNDTHALGLAGREPLSDYLEVTRGASPNSNAEVLRSISDQLRDLDFRLNGLPGQPGFRQYVQGLLGPVFDRIGWEERANESSDVRLLRASLLGTLSQLGDPKIVSAARARFAQMRKDPKSVTADLRQSVLEVVAENADSATWDQLHDMAKHAASSLEKEQLYGVLGDVRDRALAQRALDLSLTDEAPVTLRPGLISGVAHTHFPDAAFEFTAAHADQINSLLEPDSRNEFAPYLLVRSGEAAMIPKLQAYAQAHIPQTARKAVIVAEGTISYNATIRSRRLPELDSWLKTHAATARR
jgi:puromycin-sensitive aminopeptidase